MQGDGPACDIAHRLEARGGDQRDRQQQRDHNHPAQGQPPDLVQVVHADHEVVIRQKQPVLAQIEPRRSSGQRDTSDDLGKVGLGRSRQQQRLRAEVELLQCPAAGAEACELVEDLPAAARGPEHGRACEREGKQVLDEQLQQRQVEQVEGQILAEDRVCPRFNARAAPPRSGKLHHCLGIDSGADEHGRHYEQHDWHGLAIQRVARSVGPGERSPAAVRPQQRQPGNNSRCHRGKDLVAQLGQPSRGLADFRPPQILDGEIRQAPGRAENQDKCEGSEQQPQLTRLHSPTSIAVRPPPHSRGTASARPAQVRVGC